MVEKPQLIIDGKRIDGRSASDLRPVKIEAGVLKKAEGSCYVEWGTNKILAAVYGPKECVPRHEMNPYKAVVRCRYAMSPFSNLEEHGRSGPNRRSTEISKVIREIFENVVIAEQFPKTEIAIFIEVLQSDGGTRCAGITAASVALANAGIPMRDMVASVAAGKVDGQVVVDCGKLEDNFGEADVPVAVASRNNEILLLQMDGMLTRQELKQCIGMATESCKYIHGLQVDALKRVYE